MDTSDNIEETNDSALDSSPTMVDENQDNFLSEVEENKEKSSSKNSYKVLARKYRPQNFEDLMGQEIMVQTLKNAFKTALQQSRRKCYTRAWPIFSLLLRTCPRTACNTSQW